MNQFDPEAGKLILMMSGLLALILLVLLVAVLDKFIFKLSPDQPYLLGIIALLLFGFVIISIAGEGLGMDMGAFGKAVNTRGNNSVCIQNCEGWNPGPRW